MSTTDTWTITGVGVSPGQVIGPAVLMPPPVPEPPGSGRLPNDKDSIAAAVAAIRDASAQVRSDLEEAAAHATTEGRQVLEAAALMASDPTLTADAIQRVEQNLATAERAVWEAADVVLERLRALGGYMAERTRDVADVRDRLVAQLTGRPAPGVPVRSEPFILVAADLAPADTAILDPERVIAIVTDAGGPTSHTAILARALGIPAIVAAHDATQIPEGTQLMVDGAEGTVVVNPSAEAQAQLAAAAPRPRVFDGLGRTADGHRVELLANVGDLSSTREAAEAGAEGVGLFRTEFCFLDRTEAPSIGEQVEAYRGVFSAFPGRKVVIRTLDAGADKPLPFITNEDEANPALGVRGFRTSWHNPDVLDDQLRAIAQAAAAESAEVWTMAPMIATVDEAEDFVARCAQHGLDRAGIMIEVPSAALLAGPLLARAQFASIGTNDLTQYTMAADRLLGEVAELSDPWQPAVLQLIDAACAGGASNGRPVGVCGEAAADPALACVLVGLGVKSLSMAPRALADVAEVLLSVTFDECFRLAQLALTAQSAADARARVRAELPVLRELAL